MPNPRHTDTLRAAYDDNPPCPVRQNTCSSTHTHTSANCALPLPARRWGSVENDVGNPAIGTSTTLLGSDRVLACIQTPRYQKIPDTGTPWPRHIMKRPLPSLSGPPILHLRLTAQHGADYCKLKKCHSDLMIPTAAFVLFAPCQA